MTPREKESIAGMIALFGLFLDRFKPWVDAEGSEQLKYAASKVEHAFEMFFKAYRYERTAEDVKRIRDFVGRSQLFLLAPEDENAPEVLALMEKQRKWLLEGDDGSAA